MPTKEEVIEALKECYDPEIPIDIWNLGLVYDILIDSDTVKIKMTLTAVGCPMSGQIGTDVKSKIEALPGVKTAFIEIVWDPPWNPDRMTEEAKAKLGYY
ncbi:MAG: metal-sulfur cluster assembly factor [Candidatus Aenigmarchaeota archaeon]|nr:metal-sulfur cluster assembly factor [Candidatus Aenigmarchaeota archaeon]